MNESKLCVILFICLFSVCFSLKQVEEEKVLAIQKVKETKKGFYEIDGKRYYYDSKGNSVRTLFEYKKNVFIW